MGGLSFLLGSIGKENIKSSVFQFIQPMAIGFLAYAAFKAYKISINNLITKVIVLIAFGITFYFFKTPWVFPGLILLGGIATNFSNKRIPQKEPVQRKKIKWQNLWIFVLIFIVAGFLSETARKQQWPNRKAFNLFENFYRFGSFVFGGGDVLVPLLLDQYVARPTSAHVQKNNSNVIKIEREELLTGAGMVRAIPGPVFSIATFTGGVALQGQGRAMQFLGCIIGTIAIFLPSLLLILFFWPVWQYLKKYVVVYRALEGINAVVVGIMCAATIYLLKEVTGPELSVHNLINMTVIVGTFLVLQLTKIPAPFIVIFLLLLGWFF